MLGEHNGAANGPYLCLLPDGLINDIVVLDNLLLDSVGQVLQTSLLLLQVDVAQTSVEEDFARVELEEKTQLRIVDHVVTAQVEQGIVEVGEGFLEIAEQEIGDTLLEVCYCQVLV